MTETEKLFEKYLKLEIADFKYRKVLQQIQADMETQIFLQSK